MTGPIAELALQLAKLPGLGRRSAMRAALQLVREKGRLAEPLLLTLKSAMDNVVCCSRCGAFTTLDADPCPVCTDMRRDSRILWISSTKQTETKSSRRFPRMSFLPKVLSLSPSHLIRVKEKLSFLRRYSNTPIFNKEVFLCRTS